MKYIPALFGLLCLVGSPAHAFLLTMVTLDEDFHQTPAGKLEFDWRVMNASALAATWDGSTDSTDSVVVVTPEGRTLPETFSTADDISFSAGFSAYFNSRAEIERGKYSMMFTGGGLDGLERTFDVHPRFFPRPRPKLTKRSYRALSNKAVSRPIRLVFPAFPLPPGAERAVIHIGINDQEGNMPFSQNSLDSLTSSVVIPAHTLAPGTFYSFFIRYDVAGPATMEGLSRSVFYRVNNRFTFTTSSATASSGTQLEDEEEEDEIALEDEDGS